MERKHVVIIGGNFAGLSAAKQLTGKGVEVTLIDPNGQFTWIPNIHEMLSGVKRAGDLVLSRRQLLSRQGHQFIEACVVALDASKQQLTLDNGLKLNFDACLVSCGHRAVVGGDHGLGFRSAEDVQAIRQAIEARLSRQDKVVVNLVGGGFSGVEALGELLRHYRHDTRVLIRVLNATPRLLDTLPRVIADDIQHLCEPFSVEFCLGTRVVDSSERSLTLDDGTILSTDVTVWTSGSRLPTFLEQSLGQGIPVSHSLQSNEAEAVFVAGDAAALAEPVAKQSYHALDMGVVAGCNLLNYLQGKPLRTYRPNHKPLLLAFGDLNTYLVMEQTVLASPLLAGMKEAVYQLYMGKLSLPLPLGAVRQGISARFSQSLKRLLLPELAAPRPCDIVRHSRLLQLGQPGDLRQLLRATNAALRPL